MSGFSQLQAQRLVAASEQQVDLLKKILRLLEGLTNPYQGDVPPLRELGTIPD